MHGSTLLFHFRFYQILSFNAGIRQRLTSPPALRHCSLGMVFTGLLHRQLPPKCCPLWMCLPCYSFRHGFCFLFVFICFFQSITAKIFCQETIFAFYDPINRFSLIQMQDIWTQVLAWKNSIPANIPPDAPLGNQPVPLFPRLLKPPRCPYSAPCLHRF